MTPINTWLRSFHFQWPDLIIATLCSVIILGLRFLAEIPLLSHLGRLSQVSIEKIDEAADSVVHLLLGAGSLTLCWYVTLGFNSGCTPWSTQSCLEGWPHEASLIQR